MPGTRTGQGTCHAKHDESDWEGIRVPIIGFQDVLKNKRGSGRLKNLLDVDALTKRHKTKKRKK